MKYKIKLIYEELNKNLGDSNLDVLSEKFIASKNSKNGLNLFSKKEETGILSQEQSNEIINFFKFIGILFYNKIYDCEEEKNYIKIFFKNFFPENCLISKY